MESSYVSHVYPIRTTRNKWKIPLYCYHECSENCNIVLVNDNNNDYVLVDNPDYKDGICSLNKKIQKSYIPISTFDIEKPYGDNGPLYNPDEIVIPDNAFKVFFYYPLSYVFEIIVESPSSDGFTLKQLIYSIKNLYEYIYREEERTATPQIYQLKKICTTCGNQNLSKYIKNIDIKNIDTSENCCICYNDYNDNNDDFPVELKCKHIFHENCIKKWLKNSGTCPICRSNIFECENCDGSGIIYYNFTGIVIPLEERGVILNRNQTYGVFGIHSYDLEDLLIENLFYDNIKKQLYMNITS